MQIFNQSFTREYKGTRKRNSTVIAIMNTQRYIVRVILREARFLFVCFNQKQHHATTKNLERKEEEATNTFPF